MRAFPGSLTFLRAKSDFPPTKPPLSSEQTLGFIGASAQHYFIAWWNVVYFYNFAVCGHECHVSRVSLSIFEQNNAHKYI